MTLKAEDLCLTESSPLVAAARAALVETGLGWLRRVDVAADGVRLALRGRVPSFYLKQMAQVVVLAVPGVAGVLNELQVEGDQK